MPKGVEHKVRSGSAISKAPGPKTEMAKGGRGWSRGWVLRRARGPAVQKSEMPKGVEHPLLGGKIRFHRAVPKSEMPKGVEHGFTLARQFEQSKCRSQRCRKALSTRGG